MNEADCYVRADDLIFVYINLVYSRSGQISQKTKEVLYIVDGINSINMRLEERW